MGPVRLLLASLLGALLLTGCKPGPALTLPDACAVLGKLDLGPLMAADATLELSAEAGDETSRFTQCTAYSAETGYSLSLQLHESAAAPGRPVAALREAYVASLAGEIDDTPEMVDIGEGGVYYPAIHQLAAWALGGRAMLNLGALPALGRARLEELMRQSLAALE